MKKLNIIVILLFITISSFAQNTQNSKVLAVLESPWTISLGVNFVDNDGFQFKDGFGSSNWNFKNPLILSGEKRLKNYLAASATMSFNSLETKNLQNGAYLDSNQSLFAIDVAGKLYYDQFFLPTYKLNFFEAYILTGFGYTAFGSSGTVTFNAGLGFQIWFTDARNIGLRLQTVGKWGSESIYLKNYIQHSAEVIYRF